MLAARPQAPFFMEYSPGMDVIARYHLDAAVIDGQLADLRTAGAGGVSLSLKLLQGATAARSGNQFLDWDGAGHLLPQMQTNFVNLLRKIQSLGFSFVQLSVEFWGANDPRQNPWPSKELAISPPYYTGNWLFLASLPPLLNSIGIPYLIDACPEVNDVYETNEGLRWYAKRLWIDITGWFYLNGVPPWAFSYSFIATGNLGVLTDVFQGNPPPILIPHWYTTDVGFAGFYEEIVGTMDQLTAIGLGGRDIVVGETDEFTLASDSSYAAQFQRAVEDRKLRVVCVCPWPNDPRTPPNTTIDYKSCLPQRVSGPWADIGC